MSHLFQLKKPYLNDEYALNLSALLIKILQCSGLKEGMFVTTHKPYIIYFSKCYDLITVKDGKYVLRKTTLLTGGSYEHEYFPIDELPDKVCYHFIRDFFASCMDVFDNIEEANRDAIDSWLR